MLENMSRRNRTLLSLGLTSLALTMSVSAFCTSYWCEGTHKVVKPICLSPVKMKNCGKNNSQPYTTEAPTPDPRNPVPNATLSPQQKEELALIRKKQLANAVHYLWETGEDKYMLRYFHTGFWLSCEKHNEGDDQEEKCRSFIELTPEQTQGVLWLSVISEFMYIGLLAMGFLLMCVEAMCLCAKKEMSSLKINAFAAMCTVLSGLMGMVAHMMYTTVFQMTVSIGPKDWRPQSWDYGWSFALAWLSFSCCMAAAVATLNSYTKTLIEMKHRARLRLEEARTATIAPSYEEVVGGGGGGLYSVSQLIQIGQQGALMDPLWPRGVGPAVGPGACSSGGALSVGGGGSGVSSSGMGIGGAAGTMGATGGAGMGAGRMVDSHGVVVVEGCGTEGCEDCEREMDEIDYSMQEEREDSLC
ncbi:germ cell-specific gene 1-like protein [Nothobranchius furzeri]|uniref:Germ cell-specific gene 1-like protein n=2 Tax=Nothobranchius TaxID=28779 RepID=A0A1A8V2C3_NOTFU|nr:germ cell-specific gene 1-like protein [Nothobranchius furzeri]XP_054601301.1 germ cell-specific gene 1-like protein [Nothobranchius furzeri]XP_054601302.1 germ cell-specific gene 1-like protein [Nothobranchius furzeri]KAF7211306.1 germ cell-specific gene 1-like protein [Nothobranchius furzeri]